LYKLEDTHELERKLEIIREELNKEIIKYKECISKEGYTRLIDISRKLDNVIVNYIRSSNK